MFDAKRRMAALARVRGDEDLAAPARGGRRDARGSGSRTRSGPRTRRFYAMALDGDKRQADAIGSNAGHCLWTGIASPDRARRVVDRLMAPDMFTGWGIRTYAAGPARLQPDRLPHGHGLAARHVADRGGLQALRPPRGGQPARRARSSRRPSTSPTSACRSCSAASTATIRRSPSRTRSPARRRPGPPGPLFLFLETMLGLRPHADRGELELARPELPDWLGKVTVTNLRVGDGAVDLLFHRWRGGTSAEVLRKGRDLAVTIRM